MSVPGAVLITVVEGEFLEDPLARASNERGAKIFYDEESQLCREEGKETSSYFGRMFTVYDTSYDYLGTAIESFSTIAGLIPNMKTVTKKQIDGVGQ
ncbi:MAG: hypothetical protein VX777_00715 [Chlamydiota bacterium]|nr:hypothetical protein [Chlamydiota bacterium]